MILGWNDTLFYAANGLAGRSFTLDALLDLAMTDPLAKAGPIIACFAWAWWTPAEPERRERRRRVLLVTLAALFVIAPAMKVFSSEGFSPRPLLRGEQIYRYSPEGRIEALPRLAYRAPATGDAAMRHAALREREIEANDLASFPSDHAALFLALAVGILIAAPAAGAVALGWALLVTLGPRVVTGMHSPLDILVGGAIGVGLLLVALAVSRPLAPRVISPVLRWADRWPGWSAAILTLLLFEVANAMGLLKRLAELAGSVVGGLL